jgi:uracil-DNA glycosylase
MVSAMRDDTSQEAGFRAIFRRLHAQHPNCLGDEWLTAPCRTADGRVVTRPIVWSRRNGAWRQVSVLWVGAAPGNAGGRGAGELGAHGTRIPFGGDIAGANLDVLLSSIGLDRNRTFITAALNTLPRRGGGEPGLDELRAPIGEYRNSVLVLRDTLLAAGPRLVVALGNVGLRALAAACSITHARDARLPSLDRLRGAGLERGRVSSLAAAFASDAELRDAWQAAWPEAGAPSVLWLTHPSAQNMSPFARRDTLFHGRMLDACAQLRAAARSALGAALPEARAEPPATGIYALTDWRDRIAPRHARLDALWRAHGV